MKSKRGDRSQAAALEAKYWADAAAYKNHIAQNKEKVVTKLIRLTNMIGSAPVMAASMRQYNVEAIGHSRYIGKPIRVARFVDGFGVAGMERQGDVIRTHRIIVDTINLDRTKYIRSVASDTYQESLPTRMQLNGNDTPQDFDVITAIAEDDMALEGLQLIASLAYRQYASGWRNCAYALQDIAAFKKHDIGLNPAI